MKLNKKLFGRSLYKIATILFLVGYNFMPVVIAAEDISKLEGNANQSVEVKTEETSEVPNEVPLDTSEDILEKGISDPDSIAEGEGISSKAAPPFREDVLPRAVLSSRGQYTVSSTGGIWTATDGGSNITGLNTNEVHWGTPAYTNNSGMRFDGTDTQSFNPNEKFKIGELTHLNWVLQSGAAGGATLKVTLNFSNPALTPNPTFTYKFKIKETTNTKSLYNCVGYGTDEQISTVPCDDVITFPNSYGQEVFTIGDMKYTLVVDGFQKTYPTGSPISKFVTEENKNNKAFLVGHLSSVLIEKPAISIIKKVNGEDANTAPGVYIGQGDPVAFQYVVQNTGNVGLTNISVTDDKGVNISCPQTSLEPGTNMTCTSTGTHTATLGLYTNIGTVVGSHSGGTVTKTDPANYTGLKKIKICHATSAHDNPYNNANASMDGDVQGHDSHHGNNPSRIWYPNIQGSWDDIIPPFTYYGGSYPGKNWDEYGQSVYNNDCTIPKGTLKVNKVTIPSTDTTSFDITGTGTPVSSNAPAFFNGNTGSISHGNPHTYTVSPGTYSVSETVPTGWKEVSNTCNDIVIAKGETKECTITNTKYGSITIVKDARPSIDKVFYFDTTVPGTPNFSLVDLSGSSNPSKVIENVVAGTYSVTENAAPGWDLTSATCTDGSPVSAINLSAGENVTCTFVNVKRGSISGHKYYDEDGKAETTNDRHPVQGWTIFIDTNGNGKLDDGEASKITGADGKYIFSDIKPGTYTIIEVMQSGWINLTGLTQTITIVAGENRENVDFVNIEYPTIQVIKKVDTNGDGTVDQENATDWEWKLDGTTYQTGIAPVSKMPGTYSLSETQKPNYHVTSLVCKNGETEIVNEASESASITLKSGDKVVCTFTNARNLGQLIVKKVVVNDNGGTLEAKDFSFTIDGGTPIQFEEDGQNEYTKYAGLSYNIVEVEADQRGYTTSYDNCTNVTVPHNGTATCTITNNDNKPSLKLVKEVVNDNGGNKVAADWTLTATGPVTVTGDGVATSGDDFEAGTYTLSEAGKTGVDVSGYKAGNWSCTNDITVNETNQITVPLGKSTVCTIVNDDIAPSLELVKVVKNDFGGNAEKTDWNLKAEGVSSINGNGGVKSGSDFQAGAYTLSEAGVAGKDVSGYSASSWSCTNGVTVDGSNGITIGIGKSTVCTITNTEIQPKLTLVKTVDNSNGGTKEVSDFKLYIGNNQVTSGVANGVNSRVEYTVREDQLDGYTASVWGGDCSSDGKITLKSGDNKTCTITNTAIAPTLKLVKKVINDNGGTLTAADWTLTATGDSGFSDTGNSTTFHTVKAGVGYVLSESEKSGYLPGDWSCDGGTLSSNTITLDLAENVTCTITNNDVAPKLTLNKIVSNTHGGNKAESAWTLKATSGTEVLSGSGAEGDADVVSGPTFQAGTYILSEEGPSGYDASAWTCTGTGTGTQSGNSITLGIGQEAVCSITNSDRASGLTVKKHVKNDNGGTAKADDFGIKLNNSSISFGAGQDAGEEVTTYTSTPSVSSNVEYTLSEIDHSGYDEGTWSCTDNSDGSSVSMPFTLAEGQSITCEITNDDIAPKLTLNKVVSNTHGGNNVESDWILTATAGTEVLSGPGAEGDADVVSGSTFKAGTYTLSEAGVEGKDVSGYSASDWTCVGGTQSGNTITLGVGQEAVCSITNSDKSQDITIIKKVINDNGGNATVDDFNITLTDTPLTFGTGVVEGSTTTYTTTVSGKSNKEYTLSEVVAGTGYTMDSLSCTVGTDGVFTLTEGQNVTCTIVNNDIAPGLTVKKHVKNDNGGTATVADFGITLTDTALTFDGGVTSGTTTTYTANPTVVANKAYTLSEIDHSGYAEGTWSCTDNSDGFSVSIPFTLSEGQSVTCEVTNDDIQPRLTVIKVVDNKEYGDKKVSDFNLYVSGTSVTSGDTNGFNAGNYTVSEDNLDGYTAVITGDCASDGKITLTVGDNKTCKITNTSTHGKIIIKKVVEPNTDSTTFEFTGDAEGTIGHNGEISKIVIPGTYSVSETVPTGWNLKTLTCDDTDSTRNGNTANIKVSNNETVTCTFTNEKLGKISGYKYEDKNGNGTWDSGEIALSGWTINNGLGGTTTTNASGYYEFINLPVGNTYTVREVNQEGWKQTSTNPSAITIVAGMDQQNVNFGNFKNVTINVTKDVVGIDGVTDVTDSAEFKSLLNNADAKTIAEGTTATYKVEDPGTYSVTESVNTDYDYIGCFLDDNEFSNYSVESGQTYNVVCKNKQKPATLIVNKSVIDSENNDDGVFSEDEFDVVLGEETKQIADKEGGKVKAEFGGLQPGDYTFTETPKDGYIFDGCTNDGEVTLGSNKTVEVTCTNRVIDPILQIEKSNNKTGIDQYAGNEVIYTIKVTAPDEAAAGTYVLNNIVLSDIAPAGFGYILGTWTAKKNGTDIVIPEPTYNGTERAQWSLGSMKEGDEIVVTYRTKISNTQDAGLYPDIAWVVGDSLSGGSVLGASTSDPATPFVGTEVKVIEDDIVEEGEVLGASISLPNTGASTYLTLGALIMMIIGAISLLFKPFKKFKYALLSALIAISFVTLITPNTVLAADSDIQVKIMKPETPTNKKSFNVGFVVLDLNNNPVTVECFKDAEVVPFETHTPANAGNCAVTIAASGTYTFYVKATSDSGTKKTAPVTVEVNLDKPSPVIDYSKAGNVLKFKTANDGKTVKVEIHRSEKSSYTANASTKIHEMVVAPNTEYSWTDASAESGKTYYYALRSLDAFGNVSTIVSDPVVTVVPPTTPTVNTSNKVSTSSETTEGGEVAGEKDVVEEADNDSQIEQKENGKIDSENIKESGKKVLNKWYIWVPVILIIGGVIYYVRKKEEY